MRGGLVGDDVDRRVHAPAGPGTSRPRCPEPRWTRAFARPGPRWPARRRARASRPVRRDSGARCAGVIRDWSHVDADRDAVVHRDRERLGATHATEPGGQRDRAGQGAVEALVGHRRERLEGALEDALGADVDPRAGGHLAVHRQAEVLEPAELLPVGPVADEVGVGDQHPRRPLVGAHHADRLAALHEHGLVVGEGGAGCGRWRRTTPSCARPCRSRRTPPARRGSRRSPGRGCSSASAAAPRSATSGRSARCRAQRGWAGGIVSLQFSDHGFDGGHDAAVTDEAGHRSRSPARGAGRGRVPGPVAAQQVDHGAGGGRRLERRGAGRAPGRR